MNKEPCRGEVKEMTKDQIAYVESQLIKLIDRMIEKQKTTTVELETLPEIVLALTELHKLGG